MNGMGQEAIAGGVSRQCKIVGGEDLDSWCPKGRGRGQACLPRQ